MKKIIPTSNTIHYHHPIESYPHPYHFRDTYSYLNRLHNKYTTIFSIIMLTLTRIYACHNCRRRRHHTIPYHGQNINTMYSYHYYNHSYHDCVWNIVHAFILSFYHLPYHNHNHEYLNPFSHGHKFHLMFHHHVNHDGLDLRSSWFPSLVIFYISWIMTTASTTTMVSILI